MSTRSTQLSRLTDERGQVFVIFALLLPVILGISAIVGGIGNWYVHGKHLQTKADAGAFAGGGQWQFPCGSAIDDRIAAAARLYAGSNNPQVGGVPSASIHTRLNASDWYDDDSNATQVDFDDPAGSVCEAMSLDVKVTEDNSFPLLSLIPLYPDIKRRARVELKEIESTGGEHLIPIAVRSPVPLSAAVYYNEATGNILNVRYFVEEHPTTNPIQSLPASMQGWTTNNPDGGPPAGMWAGNTWADLTPAAATGVAIAISFRGACNTNLPNPNNNIPVQAGGGPCFEDEFATVSQLCNQGSAQIVDCHYSTGSPQAPQAGLHFIRGYQAASPNSNPPPFDPPALETAYLENIDCTTNGYFNALPNAATDCEARLSVSVDVGNLEGEYGPTGPAGNAPLRAEDIEVRFRLVRGDGSAQCDYGNTCDLISGGQAPTLTYATQGNGSSPHLQLDANTRQNAVAIQVRLKNVFGHPNSACRDQNTFRDNCRWFYTGNGLFGTSVAPTNAQILAAPVQRAFRGNSNNSSSVQWLRVTTDTGCDGNVDGIDGDAASQPFGSDHCFRMDMGLKGGIARDANEPAILFDDGTGSSQTGTLDCDPDVPQGQALRDSIANGCGPDYTRHSFNVTPLCPQQNNIFTEPNPGTPWTDWPPLQCVKTRPTSTPSQMEAGFRERFFSGASSCPPDAAPTASNPTGFVKGRNYWNQDTNPLNNKILGYQELTGPDARNTYFDPSDPRIVTIFLVPTWAFTGSGQDTYPIAGFVQVYVTGYGRIGGNGSLTIDDPCPGSTPPPASDYACSGSSCGYIVWGHFIKWAIPSPNATPNPQVDCDPEGTVTPCVAVLVD